jgi:hypothetical protein
MTQTELAAWQHRHVGIGPCVVLPGQYLIFRDQTPHEWRTTIRLLRQYRNAAGRSPAAQDRYN